MLNTAGYLSVGQSPRETKLCCCLLFSTIISLLSASGPGAAPALPWLCCAPHLGTWVNKAKFGRQKGRESMKDARLLCLCTLLSGPRRGFSSQAARAAEEHPTSSQWGEPKHCSSCSPPSPADRLPAASLRQPWKAKVLCRGGHRAWRGCFLALLPLSQMLRARTCRYHKVLVPFATESQFVK